MFEHKPLQNAAYEYLLNKIYSRELVRDTIYSETKIASELDLSRTPVRDALNRLALERYIDIIPHRGFRLHIPTHAELREAYHVRMMIEGYCADLVAQDHDMDAAKTVIITMESALNVQQGLVDSNSTDEKQFWLEDLAFHRAALSYVNISSFITQYDSFVHAFMPQFLHPKEAAFRRANTLAEHRAIIESVRSGDRKATLAAIRQHLDTSFIYCKQEKYHF